MPNTIFVVTNTPGGTEYKPQVFYALDDAQEWLRKVIICDFIDTLREPFEYKSEYTGKSVKIIPGKKAGKEIALILFGDDIKYRKYDENQMYLKLKDMGLIEEFYFDLNERVNVYAKQMSAHIRYDDDAYNYVCIHPINVDVDQLRFE